MDESEYARMFACEDRHWWYVSLHERIEHLVAAEARRKGSLRLFDAGCGTGGLLARLRKFGPVEGCDASPLALAFCKQRGISDLTQTNLNQLELPPGRFDVITCIDVLEHRWVTSETNVLQRLSAGLKPGGLLIVHCTALAWLRSSHDQAVGSVRRYRHEEVDALLTSAGFVERDVAYRMFALLPAIALYRRFRPPRPDPTTASDVWMPPRAINALLLAVTRLENLAARRAPFPVGSSLLAVARRAQNDAADLGLACPA